MPTMNYSEAELALGYKVASQLPEEPDAQDYQSWALDRWHDRAFSPVGAFSQLAE